MSRMTITGAAAFKHTQESRGVMDQKNTPVRQAGRAVGAALLLSLIGCTTYVPTVTPALKCEPPTALLQGCSAPLALKDGISYSELLVAYQADRQALQRCAVQLEALKQAVSTCNATIDSHNAELAKLNEAAKARK